MKASILYPLIFATGLSLGAFAHYKLTQPSKSQTEQTWGDTYAEEKTHERMLQFQSTLDGLEKEGNAKDGETLSKRIEAQQGIEDLIIKYREAEYAKYAPFTGIAGVLLAAVIGGMVSWHAAKRSPHDTHSP